MRAAEAGWLPTALHEFWWFGLKQAWACLFGGLMLGLILITAFFYPEDAALVRYDFLFLAACAIGTAMEVFKTAQGSWIYPEEALFRIGGVPLFSGFMYAAVGSYLARVQRIFDFGFTRYPPLWATWVVAILAYINFFTHHYTVDLRLPLIALTLAMYLPCRVYYRPARLRLWMPLGVGFGLVALFIWFAENIGTFAGAWVYPDQAEGWQMVGFSKLGAREMQ